jgi:hypothetical protein
MMEPSLQSTRLPCHMGSPDSTDLLPLINALINSPWVQPPFLVRIYPANLLSLTFKFCKAVARIEASTAHGPFFRLSALFCGSCQPYVFFTERP